MTIMAVCLKCGAIDTYASKIARSTLWIEGLTRIEEEAVDVAAGLASWGDTAQTVEATVDDPQQLARKEKYLSKILEHGGSDTLILNEGHHGKYHLERVSNVALHGARLPSELDMMIFKRVAAHSRWNG